MPQTRFLGRRWRLATDSLPLVFYPLLRTLSIFLFILLLSLVGVTLTDEYQCQRFPLVAVAMYGMLVVYFLEIVVSFFLVRFGWRGGPLDERKRMPQMSIMIHLWFIIEILKLFFTIWGIVVVYSPSVQSQCWSSNPCESYGDQLPKVCVPGATGNIQLTKECQVIFNNKNKYSSCFDTWAEIGAGWMLDNYISMNKDSDPPYTNFSYPGTVTCRKGIRWEFDQRLSDINPFDSSENIFLYLGKELESIDEEQQEQAPGNISLVDVLPSSYQTLVTEFISNGNSDNYTNGIPWSSCLSSTCKELLQNSCSQWRDFIELPETHRLAGWFAAVVFISFGECVLTGLIFFISFNAFPDYDSPESWQGLLSGMAKRLGYGGDLQTTSTDSGVDALVGIGGLLFTLFGGVDLDVTDVILGLYLVHLRQKWKRKKHALTYLAKHGYIGQEQHVSVWRSKLAGFILFPLFIDGYYSKSGKNVSSIKKAGKCELPADEGGTIDQTLDSVGTNDDTLFEEFSAQLQHIIGGDTNHCHDRGDESDGILMLQHSFVHLEPLDSIISQENITSHMNTEKVALTKQERPLITPLNLKHVKFQKDGESIAVSEDTVSMYLGNANPGVDIQQLEDLLHFLPIARSSYGLIKNRWRSCVEPEWKHKILSSTAHLSMNFITSSTVSSYFQRRNLKQILRLVNIPVEDVLYVSYTSNPLGQIPYLILLDRSTENICISMRGTVGVADLITDLLSSPDSIAGEVGSNQTMYAHAGMTSSARAMVAEFKAKGIWDALRDPLELEIGEKSTVFCQEDQNDEFPISRALKRIQEAIHEEGYGLVITGHSLGAAVACLVSSEMRSIRPNLKCVAFNPPGGLLDETLRKDSECFCTSVVCGQDAISRMSIGTMKRLIDDMIFALASCKRPKLSILLDSMAGRYSNSGAASHIFHRFEDIEPYIIEILLQYLKKSKIRQQSLDNQEMYPPGKIVFLRPYGDIAQSNSVTWDAVWIRAHDLMDEGILLSKATFHHHQIVQTMEALQEAHTTAKRQCRTAQDRNHSDGDKAS